MTKEHQLLWEKIRNFELDDPASNWTFSDRLAYENAWDFEFTLQTIQEYKKFLFLMCIAPHPLSPSDQVDQVWHLHLLYTQSYWIDLCQHTLGRPIHHGPTKGGKTEKDKFDDWYSRTKELYQQTFEQTPPADIWPANEDRFSDVHFQRINIRTHWIIPKPNFLHKK